MTTVTPASLDPLVENESDPGDLVHNSMAMDEGQRLQRRKNKLISQAETIIHINTIIGAKLQVNFFFVGAKLKVNFFFVYQYHHWSHDRPWRATADLVRGRVSSRVSAWLLALSRDAVILGCLIPGFDWTSRYRGASSKMITTQGVLKAKEV